MATTPPQWLEQFPDLACLTDAAGVAALAATRVVTLPAAASVFRSGDPCRAYMLVLAGSVRVQKIAENGREITLYRVQGGQSCVLTTSCLMANDHYPAEGITESEVTAAVIPFAAFHRGLAESPRFREFVFAAYGQRLADLILLVEEVAFGRLDRRLAQRLLELAEGGELRQTHQQLAADLGTAREVVSRQLKEFERAGLLRLHRGRIELLDPAALKRLGEASQ